MKPVWVELIHFKNLQVGLYFLTQYISIYKSCYFIFLSIFNVWKAKIMLQLTGIKQKI
jgi:hypothetical protein